MMRAWLPAVLVAVAVCAAAVVAQDFRWTKSGYETDGWRVTTTETCQGNACTVETRRCRSSCIARCENRAASRPSVDCEDAWWTRVCRCSVSTNTTTTAAVVAETLQQGADPEQYLPGGEPAEAQSKPTQAAPQPDLSAMASSALALHNKYRESHGVPPLKWSAAVAKSAQAHADRCVFAHSIGSPFGENLAWGHDTIDRAITDWYNEVGLYNFAAPGFSMATGHFTAMVWRATAELGCALGNCPGQRLWVCQYDPPGNMMGAFPANVPRPV